jgi:hypothetical protein
MKTSALPALSVIGALLLVTVSCGRKEQPADATRPLQDSFQVAGPETKRAIDVVNQHLRAREYTAAARALAPVASQPSLNEQEKQAVAIALKQLNQAIAADRSLDTKEMYELRARMSRAIYSGGSKF